MLLPVSQRLVEGRPVLSHDQMLAVGQRLLALSTARDVHVAIEHTARIVTRLTNGQVLMSDDGDQFRIEVMADAGGGRVVFVTNQLDDASLRQALQQCETLARDRMTLEAGFFPEMSPVQDTYLPVALWRPATIHAMQSAELRATLLPKLLGTIAQADLLGAGTVGLMARSRAFMNNGNIIAYGEETDSELSVSARTRDGKSVGWAGHAARDWFMINPAEVVTHAIDLAKRGVGAQAIEPGRRTAILTAEAVAQLLRYLAGEFSALETIRLQNTPFSKPPDRARYGESFFDHRITMCSDPADPDGGFVPWFGAGWATPAMTWIDHGVLKEIAYDWQLAVLRGRPYAQDPYSLRVSGGTTSLDQMIAQCDEGIFVNRFTNVELVDRKTGMLTGVTCDGCFLIKHGKLDRPVKNFRVLDSPFFMLNNLIAVGEPKRAAFGYTPPGQGDPYPFWPRLPMIVPPMMVRDFNFSALADTV